MPSDCGFPCNGNGTTLHYHLYNESLSDSIILRTKYRFDHMKDKCVPFEYHGCGGNWNNFEIEENCINRCKPYRETQHNFMDTLFTTKLGLGYFTGVIAFVLGAVFYVMCLPFVRKGGYFQVKKKNFK